MTESLTGPPADLHADLPVDLPADAWRDDAGIADDDFFSPLPPGQGSRPEGDYRFQGPQGRYNLTWRQEAFARHYAACGNGAEAARRAGYSVPSARFIACENLKDSRIRWRIRAIAERREAKRRAESAYVIRMLNAAMELALRQNLPNTMIRALAHMARIGGLDRPAAASPARQDGDEDSWLEIDAALALLPADAAGVLQEAVLDGADQPETAEINPLPPAGEGGRGATPTRSGAERSESTGPTEDCEASAEGPWSPDRLPASGAVSGQRRHPGRAAGPSRGPDAGGATADAAHDAVGCAAECAAGCAAADPDGGTRSSVTAPHIPLHSPTSPKNSGNPGAAAQLAADTPAGRLASAKHGECAGPEGGQSWSS